MIPVKYVSIFIIFGILLSGCLTGPKRLTSAQFRILYLEVNNPGASYGRLGVNPDVKSEETSAAELYPKILREYRGNHFVRYLGKDISRAYICVASFGSFNSGKIDQEKFYVELLDLDPDYRNLLPKSSQDQQMLQSQSK